MTENASESGTKSKTPTRPIRAPLPMWQAFDRVCGRLGTDRSAAVREHMRQQIQEHGDERDLADLEAAEKELAERRSRMHPGRPRRQQDAGRG